MVHREMDPSTELRLEKHTRSQLKKPRPDLMSCTVCLAVCSGKFPTHLAVPCFHQPRCPSCKDLLGEMSVQRPFKYHAFCSVKVRDTTGLHSSYNLLPGRTSFILLLRSLHQVGHRGALCKAFMASPRTAHAPL